MPRTLSFCQSLPQYWPELYRKSCPWWTLCALVSLFTLASEHTPPPPTLGAVPTSYELKAAFLYNFTQFITWPEAQTVGTDTFVVCVLGQNPFDGTLAPLQSKTVQNKRVVVREVPGAAEGKSCHILFISSSEQARLPQILKELAAAPVLTLGDTDGYSEAGVMINFVQRQNKLRFAINLNAAKQAGLYISAHLLRLAAVVSGG